MTKLAVFALTEGVSATGMVSDAMKTAYTTALSGVQSDVFEMMAAALPIALGITGVFLAIRLGINFFRAIAH